MINCEMCDHNKVCKYKDRLTEDMKDESVLNVNGETIISKQYTCKHFQNKLSTRINGQIVVPCNDGYQHDDVRYRDNWNLEYSGTGTQTVYSKDTLKKEN